MTNEQPNLFDENEPHLPALPYGGTAGWSGSITSMMRAVEDNKTGKTSKRQIFVIEMLKTKKEQGLTWKELSDIANWHHGESSGALSVLHKTGHIARITETRGRSQVYVLPEYVNGRELAAYRPNVTARLMVEILDEIESDLERGLVGRVLQRIRATKEQMG